jgi:prophage regulatory protein
MIASTNRVLNSIMRLKGVIDETGLSRSTIYLRMSNGVWPPVVKLGSGRAMGWPVREVDKMLEAMIAGKTERQLKALVTDLIKLRKSPKGSA